MRTGSRGLWVHILAEFAAALHAEIRLGRGDHGRGLFWKIHLPVWTET